MTEISDTDIALVGLAGRFPGADNVARLWENLLDARCGITRFTDDELRVAGVPQELIDDPSYVKAGGVIDGVDLFDAGFFGFSPKEAQVLDPQHRLFLEHSWHALEDAGCDPSTFGGAVGVFAGCAWSSYLTNNLLPARVGEQMGELTVGLANDKDSLATRVAHTLGLTGPAYGVQSYCSTSLVAVCAAATSLANFECDLALAGGVAVGVPHRVGYLYQQGGIAPPDGETRAFDAAGMGAVLGSGVGVVALRRLADALADGDRVYAVIRGWAVNNDGGRKVGFTAPGVQGQAEVVAEALAAAGLTPADIGYLEAHGTGTALGDAAELAALQKVFHGEELLIGSVKTNVGHLDRAAGVTGLIKAALALHRGEVPPTRNFRTPNPQLSSGEARLTVLTERHPWPRTETPRRAGVSAFGIGGTNAHVVIEEAPRRTCTPPRSRPELLVWSARSSFSADAMAGALAEHLTSSGDHLADVAHTLQTGRRVFEHRRMVVGATADEIAVSLHDGGHLGRTESASDRPVGFLFAGTGEQYPGMASDLYENEPTFRAALNECRAILIGELGDDPLTELLGDRVTSGDDLARLLGRTAPRTSDGDVTRRLQPALFAVEYALAQLLGSWGVRPAVMLGYSLGEYVAACLAGVLSLEDALKLVAHRAKLIDGMPVGAMAAVPLSADDVTARIAGAGIAGLDVAALNGPALTVVSGEPEAVRALEEALQPAAVSVRRLATTHAFHSRMLAPIKDELTAWISANVRLSTPRIPYVSNVTGRLVSDDQALDPGYWAEHMCGPVHFDTALATLLAQGDLALLEIGPGQSLGVMARGHRDCMPERWSLIVSTLPAAGDPRPGTLVATEALGRLWLGGVAVDWAGYRGDSAVARVGLPGYVFQRESYWIHPPTLSTTALPAGSAAGQPPPGTAQRALADGQHAVAAPAGGHVELVTQRWRPLAAAAPDGDGTLRPGQVSRVGRCVIVGDDDGIAAELADLLRSNGIEVVTVPGGENPSGSGGTAHRPESPGGSSASGAPTIAAALATGPVAVVDLSGLQGDAVSAVLAVSRNLAACGTQSGDNLRVLVVTRGGQAIGDDERPDAAHAAVAALPIVANQEYLNLDCRGVDLDPAYSPKRTAQALYGELSNPTGEVLVAHREERRFAPEYVVAPPAVETEPVVEPGGAYLITGGLGDVGRTIAEHLVRSGAGTVVLTSRGGAPSDPDHPFHTWKQRMAELGGVIETPRADVTDLDAMRALFSESRIDGVIHAAAESRPASFLALGDLTGDAVRAHFAGKVNGARVLASVFADLPAEFAPRWCVAFSSTAALLGGITFGSYAAANAALTAVVRGLTVTGRLPRTAGPARATQEGRYRSGGAAPESAVGGTRWTAASWDTWSCTLKKLDGRIGGSMAAHSMSDEESLDALDRLIAAGHPAVVVVAGGLEGRMPRTVGVGEPANPASGAKFPRPELPQPYVPPITPTERALAELWSDVLGIEPVGVKDNYFDLGGNSLLALQMLSLVKQRFGVAVPTVVLFGSPTVHALAADLDQRGASAPATSAPDPALSASGTSDSVTAQVAEDDGRIAIVGMAGRFPGATSVTQFWRNLCDGVESLTTFSPEELRASGVDEALIADPAYVPARMVLDDIAGFDASFFGMSPRMAAITDPQQRLFLEICWEALEQAGYATPEHRGRVGVFGGANISTYLLGMTDQLDEDVSTYEIIMGNDKDALTTTVSYLFDLHGPSVAVQTFCSTSLVAVHLAVRSLRAGDCEMALAGGVSIRVPDRVGYVWSPGGQESPDGHVRTFDARAKGSMFGDGATVVVLKRFADAVRDGDTIWAVIRGTAMNNDGALKVGYTAPSVVGQARVISDAMADAGVTAADVGYIEAHGTATELGDPIEVAALTRAFGTTEEKQYVPIGSVKTNVGHLDRAAGVSGLIKTAMALKEQVIPATLHYTEPNPEIDFEDSPFYVNATLSPFPSRDGKPRIAGLNSLGMGGTNVHVVVEEPPARVLAEHGGRRYHVLPVSARTATAADDAGKQLGEHLAEHDELRLADVAFTLQVGRKTFEHRRVVNALTSAGAASALGTGEWASRVEPVQGRPVAFLFAGVGEQYQGMVAELYRREPVFRAALDRCLAAIDSEDDLVALLTGEASGGGSSLAALMGRGCGESSSALERTVVAQPAMFGIGYALATTLMSWGVKPSVMLGYSLGEYVAACVSGVLSLDDALALVTYRAKLIDATERGGMLAVSLAADDLRKRFRLQARGLDVAAVNGPDFTVVAGATAALEKLTGDLRRAEVPCRPLHTTHAFHSRMLLPLQKELTGWIKSNVTLHPPTVPYVSNVTGELITAELATDPNYWARHMCETVQFAKGIGQLGDETAVIEIGPGPSLGALMRAAGVPTQKWPLILAALPAASDPRPADAVLTDCLSKLWLIGVTVDWTAYHGDGVGRVPLPTYPFQRQRYWIDRKPRKQISASAVPDEPASMDDIGRVPKLPEEQWIHLPVWRRTALPPASAAAGGSWLVFSREGKADEILEAMSGLATITVVRPGEAFRVTEHGYTVRPGNVDDAVSLVRDLRKKVLHRVVHLWTVDDAPNVIELGLHSLVALARAAGEYGLDGWALDIVTAGTQQIVGGEEIRPDSATVVGPALVIPLEYTSITTRLVDIEPDTSASEAVAEIRRPRTEPTVGIRRGRRWVCGYEAITPVPLPEAQATLRDGGVYLITGGLGGIGLGMAENLARDCKAKLVLLGRTGLPPREEWAALAPVNSRVARVLKLIELGAEVEIVTGDVANVEDVRRAVNNRFGALHGVIHAAGVPGTGLMQFKRQGDGDAVLAPKVAGTRAIIEALGDREVDWLVLYSSITSTTGGGPGQVDYCAANAFLDSYAAQFAATGKRVVSVDWGEWTWNAWEEGLAGYDETLQTFFRNHRARFGITFDEGYRTLLRAIASGESRVVVSTQDLPTVVKFSTKFTVETVTSSVATGGDARHPRPELVTPFQEPSSPTEVTIAEAWCGSLKLDRVGAVDNFFELGGNSLLGVTIVASLRRSFPDAELPPHILYEAPTIAALAKVIDGDAAVHGETSARTRQVQAQLRRSGLEAAAARRRRG